MQIIEFMIKRGPVAVLNLGFLIVFLMVPWAAPQADEYQGAQQATPQLADADTHPHHVKIGKLADYIQKKYRLSERKATDIVAEVFRNAAKYESMEPELILAIIAVESRFQERAVSNQGARGLMQVMPRSHPHKVRAIGGAYALFDPEKNIDAGSQILASYLEDNSGNLKRALLRYSGSQGSHSPYADKVMRIYWDMRRQTLVG